MVRGGRFRHKTLPFCPDVEKFTPRHPEELDGKEDAAYGDDDENRPFRYSHGSDVGYPLDDTLAHIVDPKIDHDGTDKAANDKHDAIENMLGLCIEMGIDEIGRYMPSLSQ